MAVAIDATGTHQVSATGLTSFNHTTGPNVGVGLSNGAIIFSLVFDNDVSALSVKWGAQTLTRIGTGVLISPARAELWGGVAPTSGVQTLAITWTTAAQVIVCGFSVSGADQTGGTTTFKNVNTATRTTAAATMSVVITSAIGDMTVASCAQEGGSSFVSWNNTSVYVDNSGLDSGMSRAAGAASVTMTATFDTTNNTAAIIGVDIAAAAAAAFIPYNPKRRTFVVPRIILRGTCRQLIALHRNKLLVPDLFTAQVDPIGTVVCIHRNIDASFGPAQVGAPLDHRLVPVAPNTMVGDILDLPIRQNDVARLTALRGNNVADLHSHL